jgi:hypothetical protein
MINQPDLNLDQHELPVQKEHLVRHILAKIKEAILTAPVDKDWSFFRAMLGKESTGFQFSFTLEEIIPEEDLEIIDAELFKFLLDLRNGKIKHEGIPQNRRQFVPLTHLQECDPFLPNHESTLVHELRHANEIIKIFNGKKTVEIRFDFKWQNDPKNFHTRSFSNGKGAQNYIPEKESFFDLDSFLRILFAPLNISGSDFIAAQKRSGFQDQLARGQEWHPQFVETIVPERHRRFFQKTESGYEFLPSGTNNYSEEFKSWATNHQQIKITNDDRVMFPHLFA